MRILGRILVIGMGNAGFVCCNKDELIFAKAQNIAQLSPIIPPIWRELKRIDAPSKAVFELKIPEIDTIIYHSNSNVGGRSKKRYNRKGTQNKYF